MNRLKNKNFLIQITNETAKKKKKKGGVYYKNEQIGGNGNFFPGVDTRDKDFGIRY